MAIEPPSHATPDRVLGFIIYSLAKVFRRNEELNPLAKVCEGLEDI